MRVPRIPTFFDSVQDQRHERCARVSVTPTQVLVTRAAEHGGPGKTRKPRPVFAVFTHGAHAGCLGEAAHPEDEARGVDERMFVCPVHLGSSRGLGDIRAAARADDASAALLVRTGGVGRAGGFPGVSRYGAVRFTQLIHA
jgi:hypothetical protein